MTASVIPPLITTIGPKLVYECVGNVQDFLELIDENLICKCWA